MRSNVSFQKRQETTGCYDDAGLLSYLEGKISFRSRKEYHFHLSQCEFCLGRVVAFDGLVHELRSEGLIPSEQGFLEKIRETVSSGTNTASDKLRKLGDILGSPKPIYRWTGAALVVLLIGLVLYQPVNDEQAPLITRESTSEFQIHLVTPANKSVVDIRQPEFTWTAPENVSSYNFLLLNSNGGIIWEKRTSQNELILPPEMKLQSSMMYFWQVEGIYELGESILSDMKSFTYKSE